MKVSAKREQALRKALLALLPYAPYEDFTSMLEAAKVPNFRALPPTAAAWLAAIAYVRHRHSDYDELLGEGYERDAARFFVIRQINAKLTEWRATRLLTADSDKFEA